VAVIASKSTRTSLSKARKYNLPKPMTSPASQELVAEVTAKVLAALDQGQSAPIVLIDGRAGSGKSTLAAALQQSLFKQGESLPRVLHMDDLYQGWEGLQAGSDYLMRFVLEPLSQGKTASWQNWDWEKNERSTWREFSGGTPLIVEGCGSLSIRSSEAAMKRIWLEANEATRLKRWNQREGNEEFFAMWAAQELDFYAREKSRELADEVLATD
jgi:hypothetical protein